jgi:hypothetical protein
MINKPLLSLFFFIFAQAGIWAISDQDLLAKVDSLVSYTDTDFSAEYTITQDKPGQGLSTTIVGIFRRDSADTYVIVVMQPLISR